MIYYVTFYSYKGGVGRTLALVNTAYSLAASGKKVLIWDLDLEAPSLLQFPQFTSLRSRVTAGTIDVLASPETNLNKQVAKLIVEAAPGISLLPAGADDMMYPERYGAVQELLGQNAAEGSRRFEQIRQAIEVLPEKKRPDVVLLDSRTGLTDLGAICTVQLPHTVVLLYTMNEQGTFGARRMLSSIIDASKKLRRPEQPVRTLLVASFVPAAENAQLVEQRREQLREMSLAPDFEIPFRSALLLREQVYAGSDSDPEMTFVFGQLADRILDLAPVKEEPVRLSLDRFPDPRHERGRKFEDKVATVLRLMDLEVTQNTIASGRQIDIVAHGRAGLQDIDYVVECKEHEKPTGVSDLDSLHARVVAYQRRENKPRAEGLLIAAKGFTAEARAHAGDLKVVQLRTYDEMLDQLINLGAYNSTLIHDVAGKPIERLYVEPDVYPEEKPQPISVFEHVNRWLSDEESTFLTLLGDYGTGKTWFTRMLAYRLAQSLRDDSAKQRQPIRIDLRSVAKALDLEGILFSHFQAATGRAINPKALLHLLEEGRFVLIFDGFDEMATQGDWNVTLENFRQLTRAAAGRAKILLTCRTHYFRDQSYVRELIAGRTPDLSERGTELYREISGRRGYRLAYLEGFTDEQTHEYIERACGERSPEVHKILDSEPRLREIASRPILLEIIVKSAPRLAQLGRDITIANLYEAYTEDWFVREDWRLRITRENRRELVETLAVHLWREPSARVHHSALRQIIEPLLKDRAFTVRDLEDADREIRTATFLTRDAEGNYGFSHRSFLEFFLASWIRRRIESRDFVAALRHPLLTPPVFQFLEEFTAKEHCEAAVRAILETAYTNEASENALLFYGRLGTGGLHGAQLQRAQLNGFLLTGMSLDEADFTQANLVDADFSAADLARAVFHETNLERVNLTYANANHADFTGANLQGADLQGAHLESANFSQADLTFANLLAASTEGAVWDGSRQVGLAGPGHAQEAISAVGILPQLDLSTIAMHLKLPIIAVATSIGVYIIDSISGMLRRVLPSRGVRSVAWDGEGGRLASGSADNTVRVWDAVQGKLLRTLEGHTGGVGSVAWDGESGRLASGSADNTVRVWDAVQGKLLRTLEGHTGGVGSVAWDGESGRLASGSDDNTVRVWDAVQGELLRTLEGHTGGVGSVAWDGESGRLASGSDDNTVRVWDAVQGKLLRTLEGHTGGVGSVAWDGESGRLASGSADNTVRVWDAVQGELLRTLEGHTERVGSVAWGGESGQLASGSSDDTVRVWDAVRGKLLRTLEGRIGWVSSVAWDGEGRRLASGSSDDTVRVWDAVQGELLRTLEGHTGMVFSVAWDGESGRLASGSDDNTVRVWDAVQGKLLRTLEGQTAGGLSVAWDGESGRLASGSDDNTVRVWDAVQGKLLRTLEGHTGRVWSVAWEGESGRLASGSDDNTVRVWDAVQGKLLRTLEGHTGGGCRWRGMGRAVGWHRDRLTILCGCGTPCKGNCYGRWKAIPAGSGRWRGMGRAVGWHRDRLTIQCGCGTPCKGNCYGRWKAIPGGPCPWRGTERAGA